jgi:hypothetical protein
MNTEPQLLEHLRERIAEHARTAENYERKGIGPLLDDPVRNHAEIDARRVELDKITNTRIRPALLEWENCANAARARSSEDALVNGWEKASPSELRKDAQKFCDDVDDDFGRGEKGQERRRPSIEVVTYGRPSLTALEKEHQQRLAESNLSTHELAVELAGRLAVELDIGLRVREIGGPREHALLAEIEIERECEIRGMSRSEIVKES